MSWSKEIRLEVADLKRSIGLRGLADYIVMYFHASEQDALIEMLQDPTKQTRIIIEVTERKPPPAQTDGEAGE